jgi:hypothetical protein
MPESQPQPITPAKRAREITDASQGKTPAELPAWRAYVSKRIQDEANAGRNVLSSPCHGVRMPITKAGLAALVRELNAAGYFVATDPAGDIRTVSW